MGTRAKETAKENLIQHYNDLKDTMRQNVFSPLNLTQTQSHTHTHTTARIIITAKDAKERIFHGSLFLVLTGHVNLSIIRMLYVMFDEVKNQLIH